MISLYEVSVGSYLQTVGAVSRVLEKGRLHFESEGTDLADIVTTRLHADMLPFWFQIVSVCHHSLGAVRGLQAGVFSPPGKEAEFTYGMLEERVANTLAALESKEYQGVKDHPNLETRWILSNVTGASRYVGTEISDQRQEGLKSDPFEAPVLYPVFYSVPDESADEFNAWYTEEHVPLLLKCKDWLMCRRFLISEADPQPWTHLALHYLGDEAKQLDRLSLPFRHHCGHFGPELLDRHRGERAGHPLPF